MQFLQTRRNYVYKTWNVSGQMSEKTNRTTFFSKNYFSSKCSQGQEEGIFWNILKDFPMKSQKCLSQRTKALKKHIIHKNDLHKDPIVSVKAVLTTMRYFPCSLREGYKIYTFFEKTIFYFSSICSYGHEACSDYNLADEVPTKGRQKCFAQGEKTVKKHLFSKKNDLHKDPIVSVKQCWPPRQSSLRCLREWYKICTSLTKFIFFLNRFL